jgi:predicted transcriptional regulator
MIALKVANLRPALVVLHNIPETEVSDVAKNLAVVEGIPLAVCERISLNDLIEKLKKIA